jgi:hypothetical protein
MVNETEKPEFWESAFGAKQEMWGFEPSKSTVFFCPKTSKKYIDPWNWLWTQCTAQIFKFRLHHNLVIPCRS